MNGNVDIQNKTGHNEKGLIKKMCIISSKTVAECVIDQFFFVFDKLMQYLSNNVDLMNV